MRLAFIFETLHYTSAPPLPLFYTAMITTNGSDHDQKTLCPPTSFSSITSKVQSHWPLPGLNAMASHGYLSDNGKHRPGHGARRRLGSFHLRAQQSTTGFMFQAAIHFNLPATGNRRTIYFADQRKNDTIEFDGS
ncbi:hypothetical protein BDW66DRAFT_148683 [Aspergillus desertorum]